MAHHLALEYNYEEEALDKSMSPVTSVTPQMLAALPPDLLEDLNRVVTILDIREIRMMLERIAETDPDLADSLGKLVDDYNFRAILDLLVSPT